MVYNVFIYLMGACNTRTYRFWKQGVMIVWKEVDFREEDFQKSEFELKSQKRSKLPRHYRAALARPS